MENLEIKAGKTILVSGGTGFIGSHLVNELIKKKAHVVVVDIVITHLSVFAQSNLHSKVALELIDIRNREKIFTLFEKYAPSYVFHLAAEPIVQAAYQNPYSTFQTNIMGTINILEAARKLHTIKGVIVASSDKAYGKTKEAYNEDSPLKGDHPYDVSKSCTDLIAQTYYKTYGLPVVVTRFGNVYGEGDFHFGRIIPDICKSIINKNTLEIRSDGTYVRDYLYVKDVVNGYLFLLNNINKVKGQAYNFSSQDTLSVLDLIKKAEIILQQKVPYKIFNTAINEIPYQHLNDTKIRKLGWGNTYTLEKTLKNILVWYQNILIKRKQKDKMINS